MDRAERVQSASLACVEAFVEAGSLDVGISDLCQRAQISPRSFHRYFPVKQQSVRPYFDRVIGDFGAILSQPGTPVRHNAIAAFRSVALSHDGDALPLLMRVVRLLQTRRDYWSVFLEVVESSEGTYAELLAGRHPTWSPRAARVVAIGIVSASRMSLIGEQGPGETVARFEHYLDEFSQGWPPP